MGRKESNQTNKNQTRHGVHMEWTNLNYVVHSSELASELVVDTKLKPCALLVHKGVTFSLSTTVHVISCYFWWISLFCESLNVRSKFTNLLFFVYWSGFMGLLNCEYECQNGNIDNKDTDEMP